MEPQLIPVMALLIPMIAMLCTLLIGALVVFLRYRRRQQMYQLFHSERMATIDKGLPLPPIPEQIFYGSGSPPSPHGTLLKGLICTLGGGAVLGALYEYQPEYALYGLIPIGIGVAFLIFYFSVGRRHANELEAKRRMEMEAMHAAAMSH